MRSPLAPKLDTGIEILASEQGEGYVLTLHPVSQDKIKRSFSGIDMMKVIFISFDSIKETSRYISSMADQILTMLTGLSKNQIKDLGGAYIFYTKTNQISSIEIV